MSKKKLPRGRPKTVSTARIPARSVTCAFPGKQYRQMMRAAKRDGLTLSEWIRRQTAV